ncbi:MAG TPA: Fe-S cluster assembly protein SufD [Pyrinomonadaceae bacterium]
MATEVVKRENKYQQAFEALKGRKPSAAWIELLRDSAMDRFESLGFPTVAEEEWKYTNLAELSKRHFNPATADEGLDYKSAQFSFPETADNQIVLVNGTFRHDLSTTEKLAGVVVLDLFEAIADARYGKVVRSYLARNADYRDRGLTALNTAFLESGVFVLVPRNIEMESPLQITFVAESPHGHTANFPRVLLVAEENSSVKLVERFVSGRQPTFTNTVVEIVLMDGARLKHDRLQQEGAEAFHIATTAVALGQGSSYNSTAINLGAKLARHDVSVVMNHEGAECWVDGLYVVGSNQHSDTHSVIDHKQPNCNSHQLYKGILDGNGRAVFNGKIFVREGAQKTDAMQTNKNLLLSPQARVDTKPQLEIYADDVKCAHGAAVGQIDQEEMFYLATRGINPDLGKSLLMYGFAEEVIGKIGVESIRAQLDQAVLNQIHAELGPQASSPAGVSDML